MDREHRQRLKRGSKWERTEKCAQQAPSVFSSRLLWPQPHFLNCQWLFGTIYIHQSQGLSYLFCLLSPLFLFVFVSFLTVRYLSSMPVLCSLLNGLDGLEAQWTACDPSDQSSFMHRLSLLFCFCLSVRAEGGKDHFIEKEATNLLHWDVGKFIRHSQTSHKYYLLTFKIWNWKEFKFGYKAEGWASVKMVLKLWSKYHWWYLRVLWCYSENILELVIHKINTDRIHYNLLSANKENYVLFNWENIKKNLSRFGIRNKGWWLLPFTSESECGNNLIPRLTMF